MTIKQVEKCPLCLFDCLTVRQSGAATFHCPRCFKFSVAADAVTKLSELSFVHRDELKLETWQAHLLGKTMLLTLAPEGTQTMFKRVML